MKERNTSQSRKTQDYPATVTIGGTKHKKPKAMTQSQWNNRVRTLYGLHGVTPAGNGLKVKTTLPTKYDPSKGEVEVSVQVAAITSAAQCADAIVAVARAEATADAVKGKISEYIFGLAKAAKSEEEFNKAMEPIESRVRARGLQIPGSIRSIKSELGRSFRLTGVRQGNVKAEIKIGGKSQFVTWDKAENQSQARKIIRAAAAAKARAKEKEEHVERLAELPGGEQIAACEKSLDSIRKNLYSLPMDHLMQMVGLLTSAEAIIADAEKVAKERREREAKDIADKEKGQQKRQQRHAANA